MLTPEKIARLRAAAQAAPPGPWFLDTAGVSKDGLDMRGTQLVQLGEPRPLALPRDVAQFVAQADPTTVLALLDVVKAATGGWWPMADGPAHRPAVRGAAAPASPVPGAGDPMTETTPVGPNTRLTAVFSVRRRASDRVRAALCAAGFVARTQGRDFDYRWYTDSWWQPDSVVIHGHPDDAGSFRMFASALGVTLAWSVQDARA